MRLINADALKEMIPTTSVDMFENCRNCSLLSEEQVNELIDMTPTVDSWIPCSEWLPEDDGDVIMTNNRGQVKVGYHSEGRWWFIKDDGFMTGVNDDANVILAWMPLPEPYKKSNGKPCTVASANVESYGESY